MANETVYQPSTSYDFAYEVESFGYIAGDFVLGRLTFLGSPDTLNGALRFNNVTIPQGSSINYAALQFTFDERYGSGDIYTKTYGIDEDNTNNFLLTSPFTRTKTSAYSELDRSNPPLGEGFSVNVKSLVQEIVGRGGWSSGNSMGFVVEDDGSPLAGTDNYGADVAGTGDHDPYLVVRLIAEPNLTPTPETTSLPVNPPRQDYGLKVSAPGHNVTGEIEHIYYTSGKKALKVHKEGLVGVNFTKLISHQLPYTPPAIAYAKKGGLRFKLNRFFLGADPVSGGIRGFIGTDPSVVKITTTSAADCYYYIFVDPLEE